MITHAVLNILKRMSEGERLYQIEDRFIFAGRNLHRGVAENLVSEGLIEPTLETNNRTLFEISTVGQDTLNNPPDLPPLIVMPIPSLKWFKRVGRLVDTPNLVDFPEIAGCLLWKGSVNTAGYPQTTCGSKKIMLHRYLYELKNGFLPPTARMKKVSCGDRRCVNWAHWTASVEPTPQRVLLAKMLMAVVRGDLDGALLELSTFVPEPVEAGGDTPIEEIMGLIEDIYGRYHPASFAELWQRMGPDLCTEEKALEAVTKLGGAIAHRCSN